MDVVALFDVEVGDAAKGGCADVDVGLGLDLAGAADGGDEVLAHDLAGGDLGDAGLAVQDGAGGDARTAARTMTTMMMIFLRAHAIFLSLLTAAEGALRAGTQVDGVHGSVCEACQSAVQDELFVVDDSRDGAVGRLVTRRGRTTMRHRFCPAPTRRLRGQMPRRETEPCSEVSEAGVLQAMRVAGRLVLGAMLFSWGGAARRGSRRRPAAAGSGIRWRDPDCAYGGEAESAEAAADRQGKDHSSKRP